MEEAGYLNGSILLLHVVFSEDMYVCACVQRTCGARARVCVYIYIYFKQPFPGLTLQFV